MNTQPFSVIQPIENAAALGGAQRAEKGSAGTDGVFADIFKSAIDNVKTTDQEKNEAQYLLATGRFVYHPARRWDLYFRGPLRRPV